MSVVIDLGQVSAISISAIAPTNTKLLWYDTNLTFGVKIKYYETSTSSWQLITAQTPLSASQIKALYESNADTNAFTDNDKSKLDNLNPIDNQFNSAQVADFWINGAGRTNTLSVDSAPSNPTDVVRLQELNNSIVTASNGLIKTGTDFKLGGNLIQSTIITGNSSTPFGIQIGVTGASSQIGLQNIRSGISTISDGFQNVLSTSTTYSKIERTTNPSAEQTSFISIDNAGIFIRDDIYNKGIAYTSDFSENGKLDDRWIPDWAAVKSAASTASNGLTKVDNDIRLGGYLDSNTGIGLNGNILSIAGSNSLTADVPRNITFYISPDDGFVLNVGNPSITNGTRTIRIKEDGITLYAQQAQEGNVGNSLKISPTQMLFTDMLDEKGVFYAANYFANGSVNDRWIPDWGAVKNYVTENIPSLFDNGLTNTDGNVQLGGTLIKNTFLTLGTNVFGLTNDNGALTFQNESLNVTTVKEYDADVDVDAYIASGTFTSKPNQFQLSISKFIDESPVTKGLISTANVNGIKVIDDWDNFGLFYNGDYSTKGKLNDRWIPDWATVKSYSADDANVVHKTGEISQNVEGDINLTGASSLLTAHQIRSIGNGSGWTTLGDWQLLFSDIPGGRGRQFELSKGNNTPTLIYSKEIIKIDNGTITDGVTILGNDIKDYNGNYFLKGSTGYTPANDSNVVHNQNVSAETANLWINGSSKSLTQSLSNGTNNYTSYLGSIGGVAGQPIFGSDAGYYAFQSSTTNTPARFYILPNGSPTGLTSKFEMFTTDYVTNTTFYTGLNILLDATANTINIGANRSAGSSPTRLQTIIGGDYVGSVLQAASPTIKFNIDNSLDLYGAVINQTSAGRINFTVGTNVVIGNWNSNGLGIGDNTQTYLYPLDVIKSVTGGVISRTKNTSAGTGNFGRLIVEGDGANGVVLTAFASTFTTSGANVASGGSVTGGNTGGLSVGATNAAGILRFYTGGSASGNNRMSIDASGNVTVANLNVAGLVTNSSGGVLSTTLALPSNITATTATAGNSTTLVATTAFVTTADNLKANIASPSLTGLVTITSTIEPLRLAYDVTNYTSFITNATGNLTITPTGANTTITGSVSITNALTTTGNATVNALASTSSNATLYVPTANGAFATGVSQYQFAGSTTNLLKAGVCGSTVVAITSGRSFSGFQVGLNTTSIPTATTIPWISNAVVNSLGTITLTGTGAVTNTASLYIGAAIAQGTNNYALYVESGRNYFAGNIGVGITVPTAKIHLTAGTAAAGTAPIKLTSGVSLTVPEDGVLEYDGTNLYFTVGAVRKTITLL